MRLAYSTNGFTRQDLIGALTAIAAAGYDAVELLADAPHLNPTQSDQRALVSTLRDLGLAVSNINANTAGCLWASPPPESVFEPALSNASPAVRQRRLDYTKACIEVAALVGAPAVSVTSGRTQATVPPEAGMAFFTESLRALCEFAEGSGVRLGIEYEPALLVEKASEVKELIRLVNHPLLGVNLDVGHAVCAGEDVEQVISSLAGRIWNVHLEDIRGGKHYHRVPGDGDLDFPAILSALGAVGYQGFLTIELYTCIDWADEAARRAHAFLKPLLR